MQEYLPPEILLHIAQYLDRRARIHFRVTKSAWRCLYQLNEFKIYGATSENLPRIYDTYSKIKQPIALKFEKFGDITIHDLASYLPKLTNLKSLELDKVLDKGELPWMQFQVMTQLVKFAPWWRTDFPLKLLSHFVNLQELVYTEKKFSHRYVVWDARKDICEVLPKLTNLESLELDFIWAEALDRLIANPTRLTRLLLKLGSQDVPWKSALYLFNLRVLKLDVPHQAHLDLDSLTALEDLQLTTTDCSYIQLSQYNTILTRLRLSCPVLTSQFSNVLKYLTQMRKLNLDLKSATKEFKQDMLLENLSAMTRLNYLNIGSACLLTGKFFVYIHSTHLTTIQWSFENEAKISQLTKFSNLRALSLEQKNSDAVVKYSEISTLTNLTCLVIKGISPNYSSMFLRGLINIQHLEIESQNGFGTDLDVSTMPHLHSLEILGTSTLDVLPTISSTHITRLGCAIKPGSNYDILLAHPLRVLRITNDNNEFLLWKALKQMAGLHKLGLYEVHEWRQLLALTNLTHLTTLELTKSKHHKPPPGYCTVLKALKQCICGGKTVPIRD